MNPETNQPVQTAPADDLKKRGVWSSPFFPLIATLVLAVAVFFGLNYLIVAFTCESTDDAFIAGHIVSIAPRISGQVAAVYVVDNQLVHSNDLLVEIDPSDYA